MDLELRNILSIPYVGLWLEALSKSYFSITGVSNIQFILYGLIMVLIMLFEPLGLYGFWIRRRSIGGPGPSDGSGEQRAESRELTAGWIVWEFVVQAL